MMRNEDELQYDPEGSPNDDDVEILEVVGVEEESSTMGVPNREATPAFDEPDEPEEIVVGFDDDGPCRQVDEPAAGTDSPGIPFGTPVRMSQLSDKEQLLRMRADYDNLRKRIDRERQEFELQANSGLIERLLPILDNFERALAIEGPAGAGASFREGLLMIYRQLDEQLAREGLRPIDSVGRAFDPKLHDAVATDSSSEHPHNIVVEEFRRGYLFRERVLRAASVRVSTSGTDSDGAGRLGGPS